MDDVEKGQPRTIHVPQQFRKIASKVEEAVSFYFQHLNNNAEQGCVDILGERYVLIRAASLSVQLFQQMEIFFGLDRKNEANQFARDFLFDLSHSIGRSDARKFCKQMGLVEPLDKLAAGPIHFSHSGWAKVTVLPESNPVPNKDYYLIYDHSYSFESDAWLSEGKLANFPVCIMNAGYSSGWCEESLGMSLISSEVNCRAKGDQSCRFIMAPPIRIEEYINKYFGKTPKSKLEVDSIQYKIPEFFARKRAEDELRNCEKRYFSLFKAMTEGFSLYSVICDKDGKPCDLRFMDVNPAFERYTGLKAKDIIGKTTKELFPWLEQKWVEQVGKAGLTGESVRFETHFEPLKRWFEASAYQVESGHVAVILFDITEKKKAEENRLLLIQEQAERVAAEKALQQVTLSEQKLRTVLDALPVGVSILDSDGRVTETNEHVNQIWGGYAPHVLSIQEYSIYQGWWVDTSTPLKAEDWAAARAITGGETSLAEIIRIRRFDGTEGTILNSAAPFFDINGRISGAVVVTQDITEMQRSKTELRESEERFRALADATFEGVAITENGVICVANQTYANMFGYQLTDLFGKKLQDLIVLGLPENSLKEDQLGAQSPYETKGIRKDGSVFWIEMNFKHILYNGHSARIIAIRDITKYKQIEEVLKRTKEELESSVEKRTAELSQVTSFLSSILENIPNMIFVKNAKDLRFVRFNKAGEELLGYSREELVGKNDYDFFTKAEADTFTSQDREVLRKGNVLDLPENTITTHNQGVRFIRSKKVPIYDENGSPQYLLGISEDITDKKKVEEVQIKLQQEQMARSEAEKNVALRDDFIATISHELKTPLTSLRMQLQMLPKLFRDVSFPGKEKFFELFQTSLRQLRQFSSLVEQLLDLSRITSGRLVLNIKRVFLSEIILRVIEQYSPELKSAGCDIKLDLDSAIEGHWDPIRIEQVVANLLSNAMKYGQGKPIEITTKINAERAVLMVRDQGIGISKEDQAKLFERFVRAAPVTSFRGLGLGLFIIRQIIQAHGGRIWVESEPGKGAVFFVEIPTG